MPEREFCRTVEFVATTRAKTYDLTARPQLVERVSGRILTAPTQFEACIELQRVAEKILSPVEACLLAALIEGRITEEAIHPARLESVRTKCLREWRRVGLLPLQKFLSVSQKVLDAEKLVSEQKRRDREQARDADRRETERQQRIESAKLLRMRPRDRQRATAKTEKEQAA